jgi:hypothetical protein
MQPRQSSRQLPNSGCSSLEFMQRCHERKSHGTRQLEGNGLNRAHSLSKTAFWRFGFTQSPWMLLSGASSENLQVYTRDAKDFTATTHEKMHTYP